MGGEDVKTGDKRSDDSKSEKHHQESGHETPQLAHPAVVLDNGMDLGIVGHFGSGMDRTTHVNQRDNQYGHQQDEAYAGKAEQ